MSRACQSESVWFGLMVCVQGLLEESVWFGLAVSVEEQSRGVCPRPAGLKVCGLDWQCLWKNSPEVCVQGLLV